MVDYLLLHKSYEDFISAIMISKETTLRKEFLIQNFEPGTWQGENFVENLIFNTFIGSWLLLVYKGEVRSYVMKSSRQIDIDRYKK